MNEFFKLSKAIFLVAVMLSSITAIILSLIWATVSFIMVISSNKDFDFNSIWLLVASGICYILSSVIISVIKIKEDLKKKQILDNE